MTERELDVSDNHRITLHTFDPRSDKLLICFAPQGGGMGETGFGTALCRKHGWNHIYVGKGQQSKYRSLSIERFFDVVAPVTSGMDVMTYGSSAGGYAALYFGGSVDARILAACPRNSQHPNNYRRATERRLGADEMAQMAKRFYHTADLNEVPLSKHQPIIVYDRRQPKDHRMVQKWALSAYPGAEIINVPNSGHKPLERLRMTGGLSYLLKSFVSNEPICRDQLKHPIGSQPRILDDAVLAHESGDYEAAADLLNIDFMTLRSSGLFSIYLDSVIRSGNIKHETRLSELCREGYVEVDNLRPKTKEKVKKLLARVGTSVTGSS